MSIKEDKWIREQSLKNNMIVPFSEATKVDVRGHKLISYGVSSYGYDIRCSREFKIFTNINSTQIDPKNFNTDNFIEYRGKMCIIPPNSFALTSSLEVLKIPRDVLVVCLGKSTYARCGIIVNVTPLEPEWEGNITIEISNTSPSPVIIYAEEGIAQLLFYQADNECEISYADKGGKYQGQSGIVLPKV